ESLCAKLALARHVVTPYVHHPNGTVEIVCKLVQKALRVMCSELRLAKADWPSLVPTAQHYLNQKPQVGLHNYAPITVMTGLPRDDTFSYLFVPKKHPKFEVGEHVLAELEDCLPALHRQVSDMT